MLQAGGLYEPTTQKPQAQPNIDWGTVAAGLPEPEPLISRGFTGRPVEVTASRLQPTFEQPEIADPRFQELYGRMPSAPAPTEPEPPMSRAFTFAPVDVSATRLPPLPVRGYMAPPQEEAKITSRVPRGMTDAPVAETPVAMGFAAPGQDIAMLAQEEVPAVEPTPEPAPAKEEPKPWQIGQPFQVTLQNNKTYTVKNYNARANEQGTMSIASPTVTLVDDTGSEYTYRRNVAPQIFEAADQTLQKQLEEAKKASTQDGFNSFVVINNKRVPANIQRDEYGVDRVFYQTKDMPAAAEYTNVNELQEGKNFFSPADQPNLLQDVQAQRKNFVAPVMQEVLKVVGGFTRQPSPLEIANSLRPSWGPEPTDEERAAGRIFPELTFSYVDPQSGVEMGLEAAVEKGMLSRQAADTILSQASTALSNLEQTARARAEYQSLAPKELNQADVQRIQTQRTQAQAELAKANNMPSGTPAEIKARNTAIQNWQDVIKRLDTQLQTTLTSGRQTSGLGGTTITAAAPSQYAFTLEPLTLEGALDAYSTGADPRRGDTPWTRNDFAQQIINDAIPNLPAQVVEPQPQFGQSVAALGPRLRQIEVDATDRMGADAPNILDTPIRFEYKDWTKDGIDSESTMTLREALSDFQQATRIYQEVLSTPGATAEQINMARRQMQQTAQVLSGAYYIQYPGDSSESQYLPTSRDVTMLGKVTDLLIPIPQTTARIPGQRQTVALEREVKAPDLTITRPSGANPPPTNKVTTFYPLFYRGGDPNDARNYIKADLGFNIMEATRLSDNTYSTLVTNLSPAKSLSYVETIIARAGADDGGVFPPYESATDGLIKTFNQEIIKDTPESKAMRGEMAKWMHKVMYNLGLDVVTDENGFAADLENVYVAVKQNPNVDVNALVQQLVNKYAPAMASQFNKTPIGLNIRSVGGEFFEGRTPAAIAQGKGMIRDAGLLFAAAARGQTSIKGSYGNQLQVTWLPEFTSDDTQQSIVTAPPVNKNPNVAPPATYADSQANTVSQTDPSTGVSKPLEPGVPLLLGKLATMKQPVEALQAFMGRLPGWNNFKNVATRTHIPDMAGRNQNRDRNDTNTAFNADSEQSMKRVVSNALGLYAMFPKRRLRTMIP